VRRSAVGADGIGPLRDCGLSSVRWEPQRASTLAAVWGV
jgi:hypothetical protein